jgi:hypothetical protein
MQLEKAEEQESTVASLRKVKRKTELYQLRAITDLLTV